MRIIQLLSLVENKQTAEQVDGTISNVISRSTLLIHQSLCLPSGKWSNCQRLGSIEEVHRRTNGF